MQNNNRRMFLRNIGMLGLGLAAAPLLATPVSAAEGDERREHSVTMLKMGTVVKITAISESKTLAEEGIGKAFEEIERLSNLFTRFGGTSPLSVLNGDGKLHGAPPELVELLVMAESRAKLTGGAFNATIKPVLDYVQANAATKGTVNFNDAGMKSTLELVGHEGVTFSGRNIRFKRSGMGLTLDGIAKGHIVDRASEVLSAIGVTDHLIVAGGDIHARGRRADGHPWKIAIQSPDDPKKYLDIITLSNGAIATSGGYEMRFNKEGTLHHLLDPRTGRCAVKVKSATVQAKTLADADALSTASFVMGKQGLAQVGGLQGRECMVITKNGEAAHTRGWKKQQA